MKFCGFEATLFAYLDTYILEKVQSNLFDLLVDFLTSMIGNKDALNFRNSIIAPSKLYMMPRK